MKKQIIKKKDSNFLSGALVGAVLGIAVGIFATTKTGKELGKEAKDKIVDFYKYLAPRLKKAKKIGEKGYKDFVAKTLETYSKNKKFNKEDLEKIKKEAYTSWKYFKKHL